ncbi:MAG TPA: DUF790 family protein [Blastocatellia bacterium]|nr:DUF790 family protein [Blastocatellia bacterium]
MLTSDLSLSFRRGDRIYPRYVAPSDQRQVQTAADLTLIVQQHQGRRRAELERALDEYIGVGTDYKILRGLIKILLDRCRFETVCAKDASDLRRALFFKAGEFHPIIAQDDLRRRLIAEVAAELECDPAEVMDGLYADLSDNQRLTAFEEVGPSELLDRYNLAQAQALLYRCSELQLWIDPQEPAITRRFFIEIKAFRLIHAISGNPQTGYEVRLSGPVSIFHRSQKYGIQMAIFLPALLLYPGWRLRAEIKSKAGTSYFELDSGQDRLRSHYLIEEISRPHSALMKLIEDWPRLASEWTLHPNQEVIDLGASAFVPDAVFRHPDREPVYLELLGYWTPRSLNDRLNEMARAGFRNYLLVVTEETRCSREAPPPLPPQVASFKKALNARQLLNSLEKSGEV